MLLRANSLLRGISGVRLEIVERFIAFLNVNALPHVFELGSIGASGDLVPLAYIAGALSAWIATTGWISAAKRSIRTVHLRACGLEPLALEPKEGLALVNGTSVSTGIAANCVARAQAAAATESRAARALHPGVCWAPISRFSPSSTSTSRTPARCGLQARC